MQGLFLFSGGDADASQPKLAVNTPPSVIPVEQIPPAAATPPELQHLQFAEGIFPLPRLEKAARYTVVTPIAGLDNPAELLVELEAAKSYRQLLEYQLSRDVVEAKEEEAFNPDLLEPVAVFVDNLWKRGEF